MKNIILNFKDRIAFSDEKANKIEIAESERSRVNLWCLDKGQQITPHVHDGDHIWVILKGKGAFLGAEIPRDVEEGSVLFLPTGNSHGIENTGEDGLVFLSISAG